MQSPPVLNSDTGGTDERHAALEAALASHAFARSEQLSRLLRFLCELEIGGSGAEISEYLIARSVLGRAEAYNPVEDATVRNRAHALRRKLEELYKGELASAAVRIELPKGTYRPRFVKGDPAPPAPVHGAPPTAASHPWRWAAAGFAGGILLCVAAAAVYLTALAPAALPGNDAVLREFWGPLLARDANTLVSVGTPLQLFVRPYPAEHPPKSASVLFLDPASDQRIYAQYQRQQRLPPGYRLFANMTQNSPLWGDGIGALLMTQVLTQAGSSWELLPDRAGSATALRGRNVILLARSEYSASAGLIGRNRNFVIDYSPLHGNVTIQNREPRAHESAEYAMDPPENRRETYGLITVLPSPGVPDQQRRTVVISGLASAGIQAAAEFFTSPKSLRELKDRFRAEGVDGIPPRYQVVIRTAMADNMPRAWRYETHRVLAP